MSTEVGMGACGCSMSGWRCGKRTGRLSPHCAECVSDPDEPDVHGSVVKRLPADRRRSERGGVAA